VWGRRRIEPGNGDVRHGFAERVVIWAPIESVARPNPNRR